MASIKKLRICDRHGLRDELDKRNIGGPEFGAKQIMEELAKQTKGFLNDFRREMNLQKDQMRDPVVDGEEYDGCFDVDFGEEDDGISGSKQKAAPASAQANRSKRRKVVVLDWQT